MIVKLKIKEAREKSGLSLRQLEEETGIDREYLSDLEENKIPVDEVLFIEMLVIANALAFDIKNLFEVTHLEIKGIGEF